jgi:hypothetical protein
MTTIAQIDQLISNLQGLKASIAKPAADAEGADFASVFETAVSDAEVVDKGLAPVTLASNSAVSAALLASEIGGIARFRSIDLLVDTVQVSRTARPNMREFMDATGASAADASELLYGVIGSNGDYRDWDAIMSSDNPIDAARAATAQLYNSSLGYEMVNDASYGTPAFADELAAKSLSDETTLGKQGNFALHSVEDVSSLMAVSSSGLLLRGAGSTPDQIERTAWLFGFSTEGLGSLAQKAETAALKDALESFA